ncbi:uncharacterized protein B0P05DRAFT_521358 [Gilbertella persicaria]|uniref:uncharacterized protein n=1 Tax=Gilbertella persicaria TaxID=101096 RepID=UPI00221F9C87|nr:uncharacterized protein B0P05DRAFT_521358 [Gilbertella persicaria]KAI8098317.1 hypothetical protein B0P05DRAFT_521358 [Gilbertella persicaria]
MVKKKPQTLKEIFQNIRNKSTKDDQEERELQRAIELSKKEQVKEQKRLLEQFSRISNKKKRLVQHIEEDENDLFQTVSSRPQPVKKTKKIKQEPVNQGPLLEIPDLSAFLNEPDNRNSAILIDDDEDEQVEGLFDDQRLEPDNSNQELTLISDSDCSVIDLVNPDNTHDPLPEEEDDGYLSPLEGFTNIKENRDNALFNPFFEQFKQKEPTKRKRKTTKNKTTTASSSKKRWYFMNKRKKKK